MSEDREITAEELAKELLIILVLDLQYSNDLPARYGHVPMRHSGPWFSIAQLMGEEAMFAEVARLEKDIGEGNLPCKTNPRLSYDAEQLHKFSSIVYGKIPTLEWRLWELCNAAEKALDDLRDIYTCGLSKAGKELKAMVEKHRPKDYWRNKVGD